MSSRTQIPKMRLMLLALLLGLLSPSSGFVAHPSMAAARPTAFFTVARTRKHAAVLQMAAPGDADDRKTETAPLDAETLKMEIAPLEEETPKTDMTAPVESAATSKSQEKFAPNIGISAVLAVVGVGKLVYDVAASGAVPTLAIDVLFALVMTAGLLKTIQKSQ